MLSEFLDQFEFLKLQQTCRQAYECQIGQIQTRIKITEQPLYHLKIDYENERAKVYNLQIRAYPQMRLQRQ